MKRRLKNAKSLFGKRTKDNYITGDGQEGRKENGKRRWAEKG